MKYLLAVPISLVVLWGWLHFIHDPRVRADLRRAEHVQETRDSLAASQARLQARDDSLATLKAVEDSLTDALAEAGRRVARAENALQGLTDASDGVLADTGATIAELRAAMLAERVGWKDLTAGLRVSLATTDSLLTNARKQNILLAGQRSDLQASLDRVTVDWETAEAGWAKARNPGLFRRLEISAPFSAMAFVGGLVLGLAAK